MIKTAATNLACCGVCGTSDCSSGYFSRRAGMPRTNIANASSEPFRDLPPSSVRQRVIARAPMARPLGCLIPACLNSAASHLLASSGEMSASHKSRTRRSQSNEELPKTCSLARLSLPCDPADQKIASVWLLATDLVGPTATAPMTFVAPLSTRRVSHSKNGALR